MSNFSSLLWLRWRYLLSNKVILVICGLTPVLDAYLLTLIPTMRGSAALVSMSINMIYALTAGIFSSMIISDEKEKRTLKTLLLSGVDEWQYLVSIVTFPMILTVVSAVLIPLIGGVEIVSWGVYLLVILMTALVFILLNSAIALLSKTQLQASSYSLLVFFIVTFLPILAAEVKGFQLVLTYSFVGLSQDLLTLGKSFKLLSPSLVSMIGWLTFFLIVLIYAYQHNLKIHS